MVDTQLIFVMNDAEHTKAPDYIKAKLRHLGEWLQPDPADKPLIRVFKLLY